MPSWDTVMMYSKETHTVMMYSKETHTVMMKGIITLPCNSAGI